MKKTGAILLLFLLPYLVYAVTESIFLKPDWSQFLYVDTCTVVWRLDSDTTEIWVYDTTDYLGNYPIPDSVETGLYRIYVDGTYYQDKNHIKQSDTTVYAGYFDGLVGGTQDSAVYADTAGKPDSTQIAGWGFGSGALGDSVGWPELMTAVTESIQARTDSEDVSGWGFGTTTDSSDVAGFGFVAGAHTDSSGVAGFGFVAGAHTDSADVAGWNYVNVPDYTDSTDINGWNYFNTEAELTGLLDDNYAQLHGVASDTVYHALWADSADYATAAGGVADTAAWADSAGYADSAGVAGKALDLEAASSVVEDSEVDNDITIAGASNVIGLVASLGAKEDTGHVHSGSEITSGTVPDSVCPDTLHRDYETKDGDYVSFDDPDNNFTATSVDEAISELFDNIGGANHDPNQATSKIDWSELNAVPAGFADGVDNTGSAEWVDDGDYIYPTENDSARIVTGTDTAWITGLGIDLWTGSGGKSDTGHTHDGRYYTETEVDGFVGAKTDTLDFAKVADDTTHFKEAYEWGNHSTQGYIDTASLNSEAELEGILVGVTNVFTNNDGALNDDDVSLTDVQTATTNDFHNIGGTDANSIDSIFFQLTNGTWGTQGFYGLNDTFQVDTSDATGGASGDSSWVRCSVTVAYVDTFRPRSATDSMWFFGTCIFEAGSTKVGSIWVYNKFSGVSRLIPDSTLNFFGYPNTVKDSSMARWVNVFDEFASSDQTNLQDVLDDFDAAIVGAGYAGLGWGVETFGSPESLRADMTTLDDTFYTQAQVHDTLDAKRDTTYEVPDAYVADNISIDASGSVHHDALDAQGAVLDENMTITGNWVNTAYPWAVNEVHADLLTSTEGDAAYQPLEATLTDIADGTIIENLVNTNAPWAENELVTGMATEAEAQASAQDSASAYANTVRGEIRDTAALVVSDSLTSIRFMERIYATSFFYDPSPGDSINIYLPKYNTSDYMGWAEMECTTGVGQQFYNYEAYFTLPCGFDSFDNDSAFLFYYKTEDADVDTTAIKFVVYEAGTAKDSTAWVAYAADTAVALANTSMSGLVAEDKARIIIRCRALKRAAAAMSVFAGDIEVRGWRSLH